jgi:uncharacterized membrane protein YdjX (TVP38/TMEM64 family)
MNKFFFNPTARFSLLVGFLVGLWFLGKAFHVDLDRVHAWLTQYPLWISGTCFVVIYVGITTLLWVGTIDFFRTTAAFLFGPYWSTLFVYIAEIFNASILFTISRKLGREFVEQKFHLQGKDLKYTRNSGFWWALALRMNPLVPFRFMDLGFGLTQLPFPKYFSAVVLGSPLRIFWLQFIIAGVGEIMFQDKAALMNYLLGHMNILLLSGVYFLIVLLLTILAAVVSALNRRKA